MASNIMRVLVLTASYGSGHTVAAESVAAAVAQEGATAAVLDYFQACVGPRFARLSRALYYGMLRHTPTVWGLAYAAADRMGPDAALGFGVTRLGMRGLRLRLAREAPDAVVTTHATPAVVLSALAGEGARVPPHTTVVTDFVAHGQWIAHGIDRYCVPAFEVAHQLIARGIARDRILVTGVPVRPEFDIPVPMAAARRELGLSPHVPVVLAMAGSDAGLGRLPDVAEALGRLERPLHGVLVAGHDDALAQRLRTHAVGRPLHVLGYVADVRRWMAAADLLVTKAGGMTLAEAIAAELPMVMYGSLAGQEQRNERFASRAGLALLCGRRDLAATIERVLADRPLAEDLRQHLRVRRQPAAARHVAQAVLGRPVPGGDPDALAGRGHLTPR